MASVTDYGAAGDPRSGATSLAAWAAAVSAALDGDDTTVDARITAAGTALSDALPADLGTAAAGVGTAASRDDHVHDDARLDHEYNLADGLRAWRSALATTATTPARIAVLGDSIAYGNLAGNVAVYSWPSVLRDLLQTEFGDVGQGNYCVPAVSLPETEVPWWAFSGTWTIQDGYGGLSARYIQSNGAGATATLTFTGTGIDLIYRAGSGGSSDSTVTIDGDAVTAPNFSAGAATWSQVQSYTGLTAGEHTLVVTVGTGYVFLEDALVANPTASGDEGVYVYNLGNPGITTQGFTASAGSLIPATGADLVVIALGTNDEGLIPGTLQANLVSIVTAIQADSDASILLVLPYTPGGGGATTFPVYRAAAFAVADTYGCAVADLYAVWGPYAEMSAGMMVDAVHPNAAGHRFIADYLAGILGGTRIAAIPTGSGAVDSVNGYTGAVVLDATDLVSGSATDGYVATADGAGGVAWEAAPGGGSGIAETLIDAKGDLIAGSAPDTAARLAVGTDGHLLTAAAGQSTGLAWSAPAYIRPRQWEQDLDDTMPSPLVATVSGLGTGYLYLSYFTAQKSETVTSLRVCSVGAAAATPSLVKLGLYSVASPYDGAADLTLVGVTANTTSALSVANTVYTVDLATPVAKTAGVRYAIGLLVVTGTTMPTMAGVTMTTPGNNLTNTPLMVAGYLSGQSDIAGDVTATILGSTRLIYAACVA